MIELLFLLLPVAAASGWMLARRQMGNVLVKDKKNLSRDYFKGLNYLLNEQQDKAIEVFIRMVEVDTETVETHLALGNLFRRRGEVDRAIRIHQNIIARPTLSKQQRAQALFELGQDYMGAGLLDRAENLFLELIDIGEHLPIALQQLGVIYEGEKDWQKAINIARKIEAVTGNLMNKVIAQYYCEMADEAILKNDERFSRKMIKRAISIDHRCVRASILLGDIEAGRGDCKAAIKAYKHIEQQDPDYMHEVIAPMQRCYQSLGKIKELKSYLTELLHRHKGITTSLALADLIKQEKGEREAVVFLIDQMRQRPSVRGLEHLIELNLIHTDGQTRDNMNILKDLVRDLLQDQPIYRCSKCGFTGKSIHWHCPSCKNWSSVKPIHGVVGE